MDRKRLWRPLYVFIALLSGCASSGPSDTYIAEKPPDKSAGPASEAPLPEWTVNSLRQLTARVEFSAGDGEDMAECGIVFFNTIKDPKTVTAALLVANDEIYPLEEITVLFAKSETHELRISTVIPRSSLAAALKADTLYLVAALDGVEYQFEPGEDFAAYKNRTLEKIN
jgi:hypothetical protein